MKHKNATLDDVARHAGVSYQTVSRVLNGSARVADATRARVDEAIRTLNYVPNRMAQQLAGKRGCTLGLIPPRWVSMRRRKSLPRLRALPANAGLRC